MVVLVVVVVVLCVYGCVISTDSLHVRARGPPRRRMMGEAVWWRRVADDLEHHLDWRGKLKGTEHAGGWLVDCTCYLTDTSGML